MENLGRKLGSRIVQAHVLCSHNNSVYDIDLGNKSLFKHSSLIFFRMTTRAASNRIIKNGNISPEEFDKVYNVAHHYFRDSLKYIQEKFQSAMMLVLIRFALMSLNVVRFSGKMFNPFLTDIQHLNLLKVLTMTKCMKSS